MGEGEREGEPAKNDTRSQTRLVARVVLVVKLMRHACFRVCQLGCPWCRGGVGLTDAELLFPLRTPPYTCTTYVP
jgi:hypothetical protein